MTHTQAYHCMAFGGVHVHSFNMFDISGDGYVDRNELRQCLQSTAFASFALLRSVAKDQVLSCPIVCVRV